jgi:hypothetical protein
VITATGATAGEASVNVTTLNRTNIHDEDKAHRLHLVGAAKGLSANAGASTLTIEPTK